MGVGNQKSRQTVNFLVVFDTCTDHIKQRDDNGINIETKYSVKN